MRFLEKLFRKDEAPVSVFDDPQLGRLTWSKDHEAWIGTYQGLQIGLDCERKAAPAPALLAFAREALADPSWLPKSFEEEKKKWVSRIPPSAKDELAALRLGLICFSLAKGKRFISWERRRRRGRAELADYVSRWKVRGAWLRHMKRRPIQLPAPTALAVAPAGFPASGLAYRLWSLRPSVPSVSPLCPL